MISFKDFLLEYNLKNEATTNLKIQEVLEKLGINASIFMRDDSPREFCSSKDNISNEIAIVNLHPTKGTHCVSIINN